MEILLASSSPRRRELLSNLGLAFIAQAADIDEGLRDDLSPAENVMRLSLMKAERVQKNHPDALVIGADTVVVQDGQILGKPQDPAQAKAMLRRLSGRKHEVYSGVAVLSGDRREVFYECSCVWFHELDDGLIERYVATGEPLDKAGAYGIQRYGAMLVKGICGDYFNIVGLPVARLCRCLESFGVRLF